MIVPAVLAVLLVPPVTPAHAGWSETGFAIGNSSLVYSEGSRAGDDFLIITQGGGCPTMRRVTSDGTWQWQQSVALDDWNGSSLAPCAIPDGAGGAFAIGNASGARRMHINVNGVIDWSSAIPGSQSCQAAAPDGAGGVWFAWNPVEFYSPGYLSDGIFLQHILADGTAAPGFDVPGRSVSGGLNPALVADGSGGVYLMHQNAGECRVLHLDATGHSASGWPVSGVLLGPADFAKNPYWPAPRLFASGADGFIAAWHDSGAYYSGFGSVGMIKVQRFTTAGIVDPAWPVNGVRLSTSWTWDEPTHVMSDGAGGLHQVWYGGTNSLLWTHLLANGTFAPGHSAAGINPLPADAVLRYSGPLGFTGVAASDGGLMIGWDDDRSGPPPSMHVRWLLSNGTPDLSQGERIVPGPAPDGAFTGMLGDQAGGAYTFWGGGSSTYMNHEAIAGALAVSPSAAPRGLALAAPFPNPAQGSLAVRCTLPDDRVARLALYDLAGREASALDVRGAGERTVRLERLGSLPPGVYLLCLTQGREARTTRVAIVR
jgi:hypothetical protein